MGEYAACSPLGGWQLRRLLSSPTHLPSNLSSNVPVLPAPPCSHQLTFAAPTAQASLSPLYFPRQRRASVCVPSSLLARTLAFQRRSEKACRCGTCIFRVLRGSQISFAVSRRCGNSRKWQAYRFDHVCSILHASCEPRHRSSIH